MPLTERGFIAKSDHDLALQFREHCKQAAAEAWNGMAVVEVNGIERTVACMAVVKAC